MEVGSVLLGAGLRIVERLAFAWVKSGKSKVKLPDLNEDLAREAKLEADRLRVRVDDLERTAHEVLAKVAAQTDEMQFVKGFTGSSLELSYNPRDGASGKQFLAQLQARLSAFSSQSDQTSADSDEESKSTESAEADVAAPSRSQQMLEDLRRRANEAENPRQ